MPKELKYVLLHEDGSVTAKNTHCVVPNVHLGVLIFDKLTEFALKPLMVDGPNGRIHTGAEIKDMVCTLAAGLIDLNVNEGDVVFGFCANRLHYALLVLACPTIGATFAGCMHSYPRLNAVYLLQDSGAKVLVCDEENFELAKCLTDETRVETLIVFTQNFDKMETKLGKPILSFGQLLCQRPRSSHSFPLKLTKSPDEAIAFIMYSSGTTGPPKGALRSHKSIVAIISSAASGWMSFTEFPKLVMPCHQPLPHFGGTICLMLLLNQGSLCVFNNGFEIQTFLETVEKHRVNFAFLTPPALISLAKNPEKVKQYDLSSIETIMTGGSPLPESVVPIFKSLTGCTRLIQGYASSEAGGMTSVPRDVDCSKTVGIPQRLHRIKVVDRETEIALGPNEVGEIYDQSIECMIGYLNRPEADAENFTPDKKWLKTGDAGYFDESGLFYIVDRYKEVIKVNTQQVTPAELESVLLTHEMVAEAAVVGIPDEDWGEVPKAFVVPQNIETFKLLNLPSEAELLSFVNNQVADIKKIRGGIQFVASIPKIGLGKIDRFTLRKNPQTLEKL